MRVRIELPHDVAHRLTQLTLKTGRSTSFYLVEALRAQLGELEDLYLAEQRLMDVRAGRSATHELAAVERSLGLGG